MILRRKAGIELAFQLLVERVCEWWKLVARGIDIDFTEVHW